MIGRLAGLVATGLVAFSAAAPAQQDARRALARELIDTPVVEAQLEQMTSVDAIRRIFRAGGAGGERFDAAARIMAEEFAAERPALEEAMIASLSETFDAGELAALRDLWSDPRLAPLAERLALLSVDQQRRFAPVQRRIMERVARRLQTGEDRR